MAKCLVTGGAGFIGSHLTELLLSQGHAVVILDNLSTGRAENLDAVRNNSRLEMRNGSITDQVALSDAVHGVDVIFHLAAAVGVKLVADDPVRTIETNIYPTDHLLRLAVQGNVKRFFLASTSEVYGKHPGESWVEDDDLHLGPTSRPRWAYGCSKAIDEFLALAYHRKYGLGVTVGRFFNVVGPRQVGHDGLNQQHHRHPNQSGATADHIKRRDGHQGQPCHPGRVNAANLPGCIKQVHHGETDRDVHCRLNGQARDHGRQHQKNAQGQQSHTQPGTGVGNDDAEQQNRQNHGAAHPQHVQRFIFLDPCWQACQNGA